MLLQWVSKAPTGRHGSDAFRSMLHKPRKTRDFHAAVQQVRCRSVQRQIALSVHLHRKLLPGKILCSAKWLLRCTAVVQGVSRLLQQGSKVRPTAAALAAAAAAQEKRVSPSKLAQQAPQPLAVQHVLSQAVLPASTPSAATAQVPCNVGAAASAVNCSSSDACTASANPTSATANPAVDSPAAEARQLQPPRRLTVQMLPFDAAAKAVVEAAGANPYLELANLK